MLKFIVCVGFGLLAACSSDGNSNTFHLQTKDIKMSPGEEKTFCYYLHTPNTEPMVINKWTSDMTDGSHHMLLYGNPSGYQKADDMYDEPCPIVGRTQPYYMYMTTRSGHDEWDMPTDDGNGTPLGMLVQPHTAVYVQMHFINSTDADMMVHVAIDAYALPKGSDYTPSSGFITYNNSIEVPPGAVNHLETATCSLPPGGKFWALSMHSHKQTVETWARDGDATGNIVFDNQNWEHPPVMFWQDSPFYTFQSPTITWQCLYNNTGDNKNTTVYAGLSAATDEMCVVFGLFFPATSPLACVYDTTIPGGCSCSSLGQ